MKTTRKLTNLFRRIRRSTAALATTVIVGVLGMQHSAAVAANPPELMSYKGYLTDSNGMPVSQGDSDNYDLEFRIYDSLSGNTVLWGEKQTVTVADGVFSVFLGEGTQIVGGNISDAFDGPERFIGITLVGEAELVPRMRFLSSPYSFLAKEVAGGSLETQGSGTLTVNTDGSRTTYSSSTPLHAFVGDLETDSDILASGSITSSLGLEAPFINAKPTQTIVNGDWTALNVKEAIRITSSEEIWHLMTDQNGSLLFGDNTPVESGAGNGYEFAVSKGGNAVATGDFHAFRDLRADGEVRTGGDAIIGGNVNATGVVSAESVTASNKVNSKVINLDPSGWPNGQPFAGDQAMQIRRGGTIWNVYLNQHGELVFGGNDASKPNFVRFAIQNTPGHEGVWVTGNLYLNGTAVSASDRRIKKDIEGVDSGLLDKVCAIRPTRFRMKNEADDAPLHFGVVAQEVQEVFPEIVRLSNPSEETPDGTLSVAYDRIGVAAVGAISELNDKTERLNSELAIEVEGLRDTNRALLDQMAALTRRLEALESANQ